MKNNQLYQIALTMINGVGDILARHLLESFGDAESIFKEKKRLLEKVPGIGEILSAEIKRPEVLQQAEKELTFIEKNQITPFFLTDPDYPERLRQCVDAPILFYFKGKANLNTSKIISIVGTRRATDYGRDLTEQFVKEMSIAFPELLIISGLAYGIDISAHKSALKYNLPTVAILAHGLDRIYPSTHRSTAIEMLQNGGLLTDFPSETNPDKQNFVKRNRIIAGLSDATVVIESAAKGGSLITVDIAFSYGREVFAFPGRTTDPHSQGCNRIIRQNKAGLITSADDLISAMNWDTLSKHQVTPAIMPSLFPETDENRLILSTLRERKEVHLNQLALELNIPVYQLCTLLFEMEMNGIVKVAPGNVYKLSSST